MCRPPTAIGLPNLARSMVNVRATSPSGNAQIVERLERHAGLLAGVGVIGLVTVRLLVVARFNTTTALAILDSEETAAVVTGVIIQQAPSVALVLGFAVSAWVVMVRPTGPWLWIPVAIAVLLLVLPPWPQALAFVVAGVATGIGLSAGGRPSQPEVGARTWAAVNESRSRQGFVVGVVAGLVIFGVILNDAPWLPPERLVIRGHPDLTGYVLDKGDDEVTVLTSTDREVRRYATEDLRTRTVCDLTSGNDPLEWASRQPPLIGIGADYQSCSP